jgi:hypothetical protein
VLVKWPGRDEQKYYDAEILKAERTEHGSGRQHAVCCLLMFVVLGSPDGTSLATSCMLPTLCSECLQQMCSNWAWHRIPYCSTVRQYIYWRMHETEALLTANFLLWFADEGECSCSFKVKYVYDHEPRAKVVSRSSSSSSCNSSSA